MQIHSSLLATSTATDVAQSLGFVAYAVLFFFVLLVAFFALMMPIYVYQIRNAIREQKQTQDEILAVLQLLSSMASSAASSAAPPVAVSCPKCTYVFEAPAGSQKAVCPACDQRIKIA